MREDKADKFLFDSFTYARAEKLSVLIHLPCGQTKAKGQQSMAFGSRSVMPQQQNRPRGHQWTLRDRITEMLVQSPTRGLDIEH